MLSFENWLETRQGQFFQQQLVEGQKFMAHSELKKIYQIFKKHEFGGIRGVLIKECWHLQNKDGSTAIGGLSKYGL